MKLVEIKNGNLNNVFKLENDKSNYIIRASNFSNSFEICILNELEKNNINSPRVKTNFIFENKYIMICDYIVGNNPKVFNDVFFKKLILEIKKIHKLKIPFINDQSNCESIEKLKIYFDNVKDSKFLRNDIEMIETLIIELEKKLDFNLMPKVLIHSDIKKENIIVNDEEVYLIDFGNCYFGNRLIDLIRIIMWFFIRKNNLDFDKISKIIDYYFDEDNKITNVEKKNLSFLIKYCLIYNLLKDIHLNKNDMLPEEYITKNSIKWLNMLKSKNNLKRIEEIFEKC